MTFRNLLFAAALLAASGYAADVRLLWPDGAPGAVGTEDADRPTLAIYLPDAAHATGTGVVICPGGGYMHLAMEKEGSQVAEWLNARGIAGFVLKYRLGPRYHNPAMLDDVQRAIRTVRANAKQFGLAPDRIGVMGFSAGGHLASTAGTHFDSGHAGSADPVEQAGSRPDFMILAYPVITMQPPYVHRGSRRALLGDNPDPKLVELFSNETQVTARTPPTFLFLTNEDKTVPPENSVMFYLALRKAGVPAEMHIYERGPHGVGLAPNDPILSSWPKRLEDWFRTRGLIK
ncbi:MAG: alpha/beta hydrolase [Bryobacteraceae bacterium]